jgi:hypothetical protein
VDGELGNAHLGYARHVIERKKDGSIAKQTYFDYENSPVTVHAYSMVQVTYVPAGETSAPDKPNRTREEAEALAKELVALMERGNTLEGAALRLNLQASVVRLGAHLVSPVFSSLEVAEVSAEQDNGHAFVVARRDE